VATTHTLTGNVYDLTGATLGATGVRVVVVTNLGAKEALVDKTTNSIHLGGKPADVDPSTGLFTVELIATDATDLNVLANTLEYEVRVEYVNPASTVRSTWPSGWFPLTADANLADITTDVEPMAVESASAYAQEAKGYRDETAEISGLTGEDAAVAFLVGDSGSETAGALSATIARPNPTAPDSVPLGSDLFVGGTWTHNANWTGTIAGGGIAWTYTGSGGVTDLTWTPPFDPTGKRYEVSITVYSPTSSALFDAWFGGQSLSVMYKGGGTTFTYTRGVLATSSAGLVIRPHQIDWNGTITAVEIREVGSPIAAVASYRDSSDTPAIEVRTGPAALENTFLGVDAGRYNTTGHENVVVGHRAMRENLTGFWNVSLGHQSMEANQNGSRNVSIGVFSMLKNTSGHRNIAIGPFTLRDNTTGPNNIALGADTLWKNTTGEGNIALGLAAVGESVTGDFNVGIGVAALAAINGVTGAVGIGHYANSLLSTTTQPPVAIGYRALRDATVGGNVAVGYETSRLNTTGTGNVAVGYQAGYANLTGNQQTAIGYQALRYFTGGRNTALGYAAMVGANGSSTGTRNTVVGDSAGTGITSGSNNVIVGGSSGSTLTSGTGNILIGFNVQAPSATDNNGLNIGNTIYGNVSTKRVGFGTVTAPSARVHLPGSTTAANTAPLKMDAGTLMTTPEAGAFEFTTAGLFFTDHLGARKQVTLV
jgi:hypothetical protein